MKRRWIAIAGAMLLALLGTLPLVGAQIAPEITPLPTRSLLLVADAFVRSGPDESYVAVGQLVPGAPLIALNVSEDGDWVLIRYNRGFGWIRRDLALWSVSIDNLPPLAANVTPTFAPGPDTATPFFPTNTPSGDFVQVNATSAYLRGGPAVTYLRLGQLFPGATLEPVGRNADASWVLIRFEDGFAWLRADLGYWVSDLEELPVLRENRLTPSATFTASNTATSTPTSTETPTPSNTPSVTPTFTETPTPTDTDTPTATSTATATETPSTTPTDTPTETSAPTEEPSLTHTSSPEPTATETATAEPTVAPSETPSAVFTATSEPSATDIPSPTATNTDLPTATDTDLPTVTETGTSTATNTNIPTVTNTDVPTDIVTAEPTRESALSVTVAASTTEMPSDEPSDTPSDTPTEAPRATDTLTHEPTATDTVTVEPTAADTAEPAASDTPAGPTATVTLAPLPTETNLPVDTGAASETPDVTSVAAVVTVTFAPPTDIPAIPPTPAPIAPVSGTAGLSPELLAAGALLLLILAYVGLYLRGAATASQYVSGFVVDKCPVCGEGNLTVESRTERNLGIPNTKHVVRCDHCRSVLRESGGGRWRYAVDRAANPALYDRLNNREIREDTLKRLLDTPAEPGPGRVSPEIVDDEPQI